MKLFIAISLSMCTTNETFKLILADIKILTGWRGDNNTGERKEWDTDKRFD